MSKQLIKLGHSPDPDDAFMFYGLAQGLVDSGNFEFDHTLHDIQTLNDWARSGELEVTAISVHAYAYVQDKYAILSSGASMGATDLAPYIADDDSHPQNQPRADVETVPRAQGPLIVTKEKLTLEELSSKTIAIPGTMTSAFLALQLAIGKFDYTVMMFDEIPAAVQQGTVDAGLIIHESQLTYAQAGLHCALDLGCWWFERTQLPLPLGCNVIRRDLGTEIMSQVSTILKNSIEYSLANRQEAVKYALQFGRGLDINLADEFVGMYVNDWTVDYGPKGRQALHDLLHQGHSAGLTPPVPKLDFV